MERLYDVSRARTGTDLRLPQMPLMPTLPTKVDALLQEIADDLDSHWGSGAISPSAYETAWVALVRDPQNAERLAFPESLQWLEKTQQPEGCWEGIFPYTILPTLAGLLALAKAPQPTQMTIRAKERAADYLRRKLPEWDVKTYDTPLFEFLVPTLATELEQLGMYLPIPQLDLMKRLSAEKLQLLPIDILYTGKSALIHGLEALTSRLDYQRLHGVQSLHGGYGNSPSATAALLMSSPHWDAKAATWLRHLSARAYGGIQGAMPTSHPADTFEVAWAMHLLLHGGTRFYCQANTTHQALGRWLQQCLSTEGASYACSYGLPFDVDDTAVALTVLNRCGMAASLDALWLFERDTHFVSYAGERASSISANAHVLEALLSVQLSPVHQRELFLRRKHAVEKVISYLFAKRAADGSWGDKWHVSAYYATLSSVLALAQVPEYAVHQDLLLTFNWLLQSQQSDGGWGMGRATAEETAYALLALRGLRRVLRFYEPERTRLALTNGYTFLSSALTHYHEPTNPALWVDKSLYAPNRVIRAALLAALAEAPAGTVSTYQLSHLPGTADVSRQLHLSYVGGKATAS